MINSYVLFMSALHATKLALLASVAICLIKLD